jgi:hypothetical protein
MICSRHSSTVPRFSMAPTWPSDVITSTSSASAHDLAKRIQDLSRPLRAEMGQLLERIGIISLNQLRKLLRSQLHQGCEDLVLICTRAPLRPSASISWYDIWSAFRMTRMRTRSPASC